ncbi:MAG: TlpA family protein disulfide reductase [bacterium]|nr:TlpA family protein disulfide reductase [bacterium]
MLDSNQTAPEFTLPGISNEPRSLTGILEEGPAVFVFFKVSCPVCQFALPFLDRIRAGGGLQVIGVSQDDAASTTGFLEEYKLGMEALLDDTDRYEVSNAFAITHVPSLFLVEQDRRISLTVDGFSKSDYETLGARAGAAPFLSGEYVPEWKAG